MRKTSRRKKLLVYMSVREKLDYYQASLNRLGEAATRIFRRMTELLDSHEWAIIRILEDPRTSQGGITLPQCVMLLRTMFPRIREEHCLKALEILIEQGLVRRRADDSSLYALNDRMPAGADTDGTYKMLLIDSHAHPHPELKIPDWTTYYRKSGAELLRKA